METLAHRQGSVLQQFSVTQRAESLDHDRPLGRANLTHFACVCTAEVRSQQFSLWGAFVPLYDVVQSRLTLRRLKLGREAKGSPLRSNAYYEPDIYKILHDELLQRDEPKTSNPRFNLHSLHLVGTILRKPLPEAPLIFTRVEVLQDLCLESCDGVTQLLTSLTSFIGLKLKRFWLRCEEDNPQFRTALNDFLESFSGLIHLAILLDNAKNSLRIKDFVFVHGESLKTLVWESRRDPRKSLQRNTFDMPFLSSEVD